MNRLIKTLGMAVGTLAIVVGVAGFAAPAKASAACVDSTWATWSPVHNCVRYIQRMLNGTDAVWDYSGTAALVPDGDFGSKTMAKTRAFQKFAWLSQDAQVGPKTWRSLCNDISAAAMWRGGELASVRDGYSAGYLAHCYEIVPHY